MKRIKFTTNLTYGGQLQEVEADVLRMEDGYYVVYLNADIVKVHPSSAKVVHDSLKVVPFSSREAVSLLDEVIHTKGAKLNLEQMSALHDIVAGSVARSGR